VERSEDELVEELINELQAKEEPEEHVLQLEGLDILTGQPNIFTEQLLFSVLQGENLHRLKELAELESHRCYVVEWRYRVERQGVRRLNGGASPPRHETGRQRKAFFYWLGKRSSIKEQSRCALALRDMDKERQDHVRVEQGEEPPVFLSLFNDRLLITSTTNGSGWFLVVGSASKPSAFSAEELEQPMELRSQGIYLKVEEDAVSLRSGIDAPAELMEGAIRLGAHLADRRRLPFNSEAQSLNIELTILSPLRWSKAPHLYRVYETEVHELENPRYGRKANFVFRQSDLRDTMLVDQQSHMWVWSDHIVSTFALKLAKKLWSPRPLDSSTATVISKGREPSEFKALFPTWVEFAADNLQLSVEDPQPLTELLHERTRPRSIDELRNRQLPKGCDTSHLESYLSDEDFHRVFKLSREEYELLPRWKRIAMKKEARLF